MKPIQNYQHLTLSCSRLFIICGTLHLTILVFSKESVMRLYDSMILRKKVMKIELSVRHVPLLVCYMCHVSHVMCALRIGVHCCSIQVYCMTEFSSHLVSSSTHCRRVCFVVFCIEHSSDMKSQLNIMVYICMMIA